MVEKLIPHRQPMSARPPKTLFRPTLVPPPRSARLARSARLRFGAVMAARASSLREPTFRCSAPPCHVRVGEQRRIHIPSRSRSARSCGMRPTSDCTDNPRDDRSLWWPADALNVPA
jgi:hypothetical protein